MSKNDEAEQQAAPRKSKTPTTLGRRSTEGAWLTYSRAIGDEGAHERVVKVHGVYPDRGAAGEAIISALESDGQSTLRRVFVPWGLTLAEVLAQSE